MTQTKKITAIAITSFLAAAMLLGALAFYLLYPSRYVSLDVNPGIELHVNRLNQVVSMNAANEDAKVILERYQSDGKNLDAVVDALMEQMVLDGYLAADQNNDILITSSDDDASRETLQRVTKQVQTSLERHALPAEILTQSILLDKAAVQAASQHHVSPGKMAVMDRLMAQDSSLTVEDLAGTRISDLVAFAAAKKIPLDLLEDRLDDLKNDAAGDTSELEALEEALDDLEDAQEESSEMDETSDIDDADDKDDVSDADDADDKDDVSDADDADDKDDASDADDADDKDDVSDADDADDKDDVSDADDADDKDDVSDADDKDDIAAVSEMDDEDDEKETSDASEPVDADDAEDAAEVDD